MTEKGELTPINEKTGKKCKLMKLSILRLKKPKNVLNKLNEPS